LEVAIKLQFCWTTGLYMSSYFVDFCYKRIFFIQL